MCACAQTLNSTAREDELVIYLSSGHAVQQQQVALLPWDSNVRSSVVCQGRIAKAAYAKRDFVSTCLLPELEIEPKLES
jgi:hypothetical protein